MMMMMMMKWQFPSIHSQYHCHLRLVDKIQQIGNDGDNIEWLCSATVKLRFRWLEAASGTVCRPTSP